MSFDPNAMQELQHIARDRYQRNGGGGAQKVHATSKAYDEARGYKEMTSWEQLVYRTNLAWRDAAMARGIGVPRACHLSTHQGPRGRRGQTDDK